MRRLLRKRVLLPAAIASAFAVSAAAFAAWTATGSGTATAAATTAQSLSITSDAATGLFPTGSVNLDVHIANPNPYAVDVTSIAQDSGGQIAVDAAHENAGCTLAQSGVTFNAATGLHVRVAAGGTTTTTLTNAVSMSNAAVDACQGATFTVPLTLTGASTN